MQRISLSYLVIIILLLTACGPEENVKAKFELERVFVGATEINLTGSTTSGVPIDQGIALQFSSSVNAASVEDAIVLRTGETLVNSSISIINKNKTILIIPSSPLSSSTVFTIDITDELKGKGGQDFEGTQIQFKTAAGNLTIKKLIINGTEVGVPGTLPDTDLDFSAVIEFTVPVNGTTLTNAIGLTGMTNPALQISLSEDKKTATVTSSEPLAYLSQYSLSISSTLKGSEGQNFTAVTKTLFTTLDGADKLPRLPKDEDTDNNNDNDLLSVVQKQTFKYFWDFAHPASGMARERNTSGDLVTSGGSGFGIMALIVGMERNFITRAEGLERMDKILDFLETADEFHGAWSHWINGNNGNVIPFSSNDNGGDLVETAFLVEGLITFRQYLSNNSISNSYDLVNRINALWQRVDWEWYRKETNEDVLYWHWSPDKNWVMNHQIKGWNECLITYVLAASSPTHTISKDVYDEGWASTGGMRNGNAYEGIVLPLGFPYGGPLFFTHYSFMGMDPRELSDQYANYWTQNVAHSLINYNYCVRNPKNFAGYSDECWGLTASDSNVGGYNAHSPTNDHGVITPTAALSSFPYTPDESMRALKFFYYKMGDRLWGEYGFYDAFNPSANWYTNSYLAIDQGPIIVMIENYRTQLLWNLFMSAPEVQDGLYKLGFEY